MGLMELFNQWIVERGSAAVQEKHLAFFRDQLAGADKKMALLESENTILKTENENLKSDLKKSQTEAENLKDKIHGTNLSLKYGVYWDNDGNPHCPKCKTPTSQIAWATYVNRQIHALKCSCTDKPFVLMENGEPIHAQEAMKLMTQSANRNKV